MFMQISDSENGNMSDELLNMNYSWGPEDEEPEEEEWNDEDDEDFDDRTEDMDDLHEIQAGDDWGEPDPDDDDHLPEDE
jgi:hypothetical protein